MMSRRMSWFPSVILLGCIVSGCGAFLPPAGDGKSGIRGVVLAGPQCPVVTPDSGPECDDQPLSATIIVRRTSCGCEVTRFTSGPDGEFEVALAPGAYELDPQPGSPSGLPFASPQTVEVSEGQFTETTILYDTGIR